MKRKRFLSIILSFLLIINFIPADIANAADTSKNIQPAYVEDEYGDPVISGFSYTQISSDEVYMSWDEFYDKKDSMYEIEITSFYDNDYYFDSEIISSSDPYLYYYLSPGEYEVNISATYDDDENYEYEYAYNTFYISVQENVLTGLKYTINDYRQVLISWDEFVNNPDSIYQVTIYDDYQDIIHEETVYDPQYIADLPSGNYSVKVDAQLNTENLSANSYKTMDLPISYNIENFHVNARGYHSMNLTWNNCNFASGYEIWRYSYSQDDYILERTLPADTNNFIVTGLSKNLTYTYTMRPIFQFNGEIEYGDFTDDLSDITGVKKAKIKSITRYPRSLTIKWTKVSKANGYCIYRSTSRNGVYKKVKTITNGSTTSYTNKNLAKGKTYYYKVKAYRNINSYRYYSAYSNSYKATTKKYGTPVLSAIGIDEDYLDSYYTNYYAIQISNKSGYTMYINSSAFLSDYDYYSYDRNLRVCGWSTPNGQIHKTSTVKISPHSTKNIFFYTSNASWYDNDSLIYCKFKLDGQSYKLKVGYNYGWRWWKL